MTRIAETLTFGIEIETTVPYTTVDAERLSIGGYHSGNQVPYLPEGWRAERDGSINCPAGYAACEIVSPVLKGAEGLARVESVITTLNAKGHKVNSSCGVHVHIGFAGKSGEELARLITLVSFLEKGLYAITGTKSRERSNWCVSTKKRNPYGAEEIKSAKQFLACKQHEKYSILNIRPLTSDKKTVEFRVFSGSLEAVKIIGWVMICLGIVEKALMDKRAVAWDGGKDLTGSKMGRSGAGATEVERLLFILGWAHGNTKKHGLIFDGIKLSEITKEMRRLGAKYDGSKV